MSGDLDWDDEDFEVSDLSTLGQQKVAEELSQKFKGEDEEAEAAKKKSPPQPKPAATKEKSKYADKSVALPVEDPLDDPVAEKLRLAKKQEEADFRHTVEMFGGGESVRKLDSFTPVSTSEFDEYARLIVLKYLTPHRLSNHYKSMIKNLFKEAVGTLSATEIKDMENCLASVRHEKTRIEKIEKENAVKKGKKVNLKMETSAMSAGLDENLFDLDDDNDDFM